MRVFITNLGCKLNQAESDRLAREFVECGHVLVDTLDEANVHIVNSCTVTHLAARDSRKSARRAGRVDQRIRTVLTGCHVDASPEEAGRIAGVDLVVPNGAKHLLLARVEELFANDEALAADEDPSSTRSTARFCNSRALVKIEDGCNMRCSFCVIPVTRGRQQSRSVADVLAEVRSLVTAGFQEVILTGVQISSYSRQDRELFDLVTEILERTTVPRLRLTSIAPWQFDERLLDLPETGRVCRHFHLSLQSGCDSTLRKMRRPYSTDDFLQIVASIRQRDPSTAITTDVIVGFPGESEESFERSLRYVDEMNFARVHAFPFSPRPHTAAATFPAQVSHDTKRERMSRMLRVARESERRFWTAQLGTETEVLWERPETDMWVGMTDNYIRVVSGDEQNRRALSRARLARISGNRVEVETAKPGPDTETGANGLAVASCTTERRRSGKEILGPN